MFRSTVQSVRTLLAVGVAGISGLACSDTPVGPDIDLRTARVVTVEFGEYAPRAAALSAFVGNRDPMQLNMTLYTVEGRPTYWTLDVIAGRAILTRDERADGGGIRTDTLTAMALAQLVPSQWANNVEVVKERLEPVGKITGTPKERVFYLVHPSCISGSCSSIF